MTDMPQPWQEAEVDGRTIHHDPLRGWEPGPAPDVHHRRGRERTRDEERALAGHGLDDAATLTRRMTALPRRGVAS